MASEQTTETRNYIFKPSKHMKKFYSFILTVALLFVGVTHVSAQSTSGKVYVGHAANNDYIYEYDGLSLDHNAKVGCAIRVTRKMLEPYIGGTITGMRVGWDTSEMTGTYSGFVRSTFNGENLATGKATVRYNYNDNYPGWNTLNTTRYAIPEDVDQLIVGFTTDLKKGVCAIPMLYPHDVPNSCFLWVEGQEDSEGNPIWSDMSDRGILPILLIIQDTHGTFNYMPVITEMLDNGVMETSKAGDCLIRISNLGSQPLKSLEFTTKQGEEVFSKNVTLSSPIAPSMKSGRMLAPLYCFQSGDTEFSITKVNGKEISNPPTVKTRLVGVSEEVAAQYTRRPLVEYFESENSYMSPRYYDEIVAPSLASVRNKLTFVCQHMDDQFMTGDDDATTLMLQLCNGDSAKAEVPCMSIDRAVATDNIAYQQNISAVPKFSVLYDPYGLQAYNAALTHPTFVAVSASGALKDDMSTIDITVDGEVAAGCMPEGEKPRLTVYLMESDVFSDSQMFWTEEEKEEHQGEYTHANIIREIVTDLEGEEITDGGTFHTSLQTYMDPYWNMNNLYLVAIVHRDAKQGAYQMQVLNTAEGRIDVGDGVGALPQENSDKRTQGATYDLSGRRVNRSAIQHGIYITNGKKVIR